MADKVAKTLKELVHLDYDAIEAYEAAIVRLQDSQVAAQLTEFKQDHINHTRNLGALLQQRNEQVPTGPDLKRLLTKGKVVLADLGDDHTILKAMSANEKVTNEVYEKALEIDGLTPDIRQVLLSNLNDERRHKNWIDQRIDQR